MALAQPAPVKPNPYDEAILREFDAKPPVAGKPAAGGGIPAPPAGLAAGPGAAEGTTGVPAPTPKPAASPSPQGVATPPAAPTGGGLDSTMPIAGPGTAESTGPVPMAPPTDPNVALQQIGQAFQTLRGRAMTPQEQQQLIAAVGYTSGPVTAQQYQQAMALVQGSGGTPPPGGAPPGAPPAAPPVAGAVSPNVAVQQVGQAFMTKFGRAMTPQEQAWLQQMAGYTSGNVTPDQLKAALAAVGNYTGNLQAPVNVTTPPTPQAGAANAQLLELLKKPWGTVDPNDPAFKARIDANRQATQRSATRKRAALAERAAARGGLNAGGFDVDTERVLSEQGDEDARFEADVYANELQQQKQQLMQAIQLATQAGLQSEAQRLQEKLGMLDIDLRRYLGKGNLSLGLLGQQLGNQHFNDDLGARLAALQQQMNSDAFRQLLGI